MPAQICTDGPFRLHFAGARAKGKRSSQNQLTASGFFENFQLFWQLISQLSSDRWHVHPSHDVPAGIAAKRNRGSGQWHIVQERNQVRAGSAALKSSVNLWKERLESVNKGKGEWEVRMLFRRSTGPSWSPCVAVFIRSWRFLILFDLCSTVALAG